MALVYMCACMTPLATTWLHLSFALSALRNPRHLVLTFLSTSFYVQGHIQFSDCLGLIQQIFFYFYYYHLG